MTAPSRDHRYGTILKPLPQPISINDTGVEIRLLEKSGQSLM